jgi:hypothetical protein
VPTPNILGQGLEEGGDGYPLKRLYLFLFSDGLGVFGGSSQGYPNLFFSTLSTSKNIKLENKITLKGRSRDETLK